MCSKSRIDDPLFTYESSCRRSSFRLQIPENESVTFTFAETTRQAIDIGAGGLSFRNTGLKKGDKGPVQLEIPGAPHIISAILEIRTICEGGICHCAFADIAEGDAEIIHRYVLKKQKEMLRSRKASHGTRSRKKSRVHPI